MKWNLFLLITFLLVLSSAVYAVDISDCAVLDQQGETYYLTADITDSSQDTCIDITANDVTLDCQGNTIDGDDIASFGVSVNRAVQETTNITIKNCVITDWSVVSVFLFNADENTIIDTEASSSQVAGIGLQNSDNNLLSNIIATDNGAQGGIIIVEVDYSEFINITSSNNIVGFFISNAYFNTIRDSRIEDNAQYGFNINTAGSNNFYNNLINNTENSFTSLDVNYLNTSRQTGDRIISDGTEIGGNFWANPNGTGYSETCDDADQDGFCDQAYTIVADNTDYLPLSDEYHEEPPEGIEISECTVLDQQGETYLLTEDIVDSSQEICMDVVANDIILDCQDHTIDGTEVGKGIYIFRASPESVNITIRNCVITDHYWGFMASQSNDILITDSVANSNRIGFGLYSSSSNTIIDSEAQDNVESDFGMLVETEENCNNKLENFVGSNDLPFKYFNSSVDLSNEQLSGLVLCNADDSTIENVVIDASPTEGNNLIYVLFTENSEFTNINASNNYIGFFIVDSNFNTITESTLSNNLGGIVLEDSEDNLFYNNFFDSTMIDVMFQGVAYANDWNTARQPGTRIFSDGNEIGGNYYVGYSATCDDLDSDGFCDLAYDFETQSTCTPGVDCSGNADHLPLSDEYVGQPSEEIEISDCEVLDQQGATYLLTEDVVINPSYMSCIGIIADDLTFDCQGNAVNGGTGFAIVSQNANNITIQNCVVPASFWGIVFMNVNNSVILDSTVSSSEVGFGMDSSYENVISGSTATSNQAGFAMSASADNLIYNNLFDNTANIVLQGLIYANDWNTTKQVGTRIFSDGNEIGGNYYVGYSDICDDFDADGFCDDAYTIETGNVDHLPLSNKFGEPPVISEIEISDCAVLDQQGVTYLLTADIIDSSQSNCINITANDLTFDCQGYTIDGVLDSVIFGITVYRDSSQSTNITIKNCEVTEYERGYYFFNSDSNNILNSVARDNTAFGFQFYQSDSNTILNSTADSNGGGIYNLGFGFALEHSELNTFTDCTSKDSMTMDFYALVDETECNNNIVNMVGSNDLPIKLFNSEVDISNEELSELILCDADNSNIQDVTISGSASETNNGLVALYTDSSEFTNIVSSDNYMGMLLRSSHFNEISDSVFSGNFYGMYFEQSCFNNSIYNNHFKNDNFNMITDETTSANYLNTTRQEGDRIYSEGTEIGGNYWSNSAATGYSDTCDDLDTDGFCDDPYTALEGNTDYLPLSDEYIAPEGIEISDCAVLDQQGETYFLTADIIDSSAMTCLDITANDVTLDCQGYTVDGNGGSIGIGISRAEQGKSNATIKNCITTEWGTGGIAVQYGDGNTIINCTSNLNSMAGMIFTFSDSNTILDSTANNNMQFGLGMGYSEQNTVSNFEGNSNAMAGLYFSDVTSNTITDSIVQENAVDVYLMPEMYTPEVLCDNTFENVTGSNDLPVGFYNSQVNLADQTFSELFLCNADNSNVENVVVTGSQTINNNGVFLIGTDGSTLRNMDVSNNYFGFYFILSNSNTLTESIMESNEMVGVFVDSAGNLIYNNVLNNSFNAMAGGVNAWSVARQEGDRVYSEGNEIGGNYYSNQFGTGYSDVCDDLDTDGFCDNELDLQDGDSDCTGSDNCDFLPLSNEFVCVDNDGDTYCAGSSDCDDNNASINPDAEDILNSVDDDCDGSIDEFICGNGVLEVPESCDDGNFINGDGCSDVCFAENLDEEIEEVEVVDNEDGTYDYTATTETGVPMIEIQNNEELVDLSEVIVEHDASSDSVSISVENLSLTGTTKSFTLIYFENFCVLDQPELSGGNIVGSAACFSHEDRITWGVEGNQCDQEGVEVIGKDQNGVDVSQYTCERVIIEGSNYSKISGLENTYIIAVDDADGDGFYSDEDCDDNNPDFYPGAEEICDNLDNDCNGIIDDNPTEPCCSDEDGDGFAGTPLGCGPDCDDTNNEIYPGTTELCNNLDDNCDGTADEELTQSCGTGVCEGTETCSEGIWSSCSTEGQDAGVCALCVDGNASYDETQDVDCSPYNNEEIATCFNIPDNISYTWDYGAAFASECVAVDECSSEEQTITNTCDIAQCGAECEEDSDCPYTVCTSYDGCYDGTYREYINMANTCQEGCDCTSNDCGLYDEIITDVDEDGFDTECDEDCNDNDNTINPGALEICDRKDNDCDGVIPVDEIDNEGDGFTECEGDCDDADPESYPGAPELCDLKDNNCDGVIDEGCMQSNVEFTKTSRGNGRWHSPKVVVGVEGQDVVAYDKSCAEGVVGDSWADFTRRPYSNKETEIEAIINTCGDPVDVCTTDSEGECSLNLPENVEYITFSEFPSWSCIAKIANRPPGMNWRERWQWMKTQCQDTGDLKYAIQKNPVDSPDDVAIFAVFETRWGALHPIVHLGTIFGSVLDVSATEYILQIPDGEVFDEVLDPNNEVELLYPLVLTSDSDWEVAISATPPEGYEIVTPTETPIDVSEENPQTVVIGYKPIVE
ncbi:MAG: hypothetical protein GY861_27410 [bacterium]|nr:hypothetical protein [bacterium]